MTIHIYIEQWKKYGVENFKIEKIDETISQDELNKLELYYIKLFENNSYNTNFSGKKCGGDTLSHNKNRKDICNKISLQKRYDKNPNAQKIKVIDIENNIEQTFNSIKECQDIMGIERHDIISKRARGIIKKPYKNRYLFKYIV